MASTAFVSRPNVSFSSTGTIYGPVVGYMGTTFANEALTQVRIPKAGKLRRLRVYCDSNTSATATFTVAVRVNGVTTALSLTIPAGATGAFTLDGVDIDVSAGDLINFAYVKSTASGAITIRLNQIDFEANDGIHTQIHCFSGRPVSIQTASDDRWTHFNGVARATIDGWADSITGQNSRADILYASGAITSMRVTVILNTFDVATTFVLVQNAVDTGLSVTIPPGSGQTVVSASGNITVNPGDMFQWRRMTAGRTSGNFQLGRIEAVFESDNGSWDLLTGWDQNADVTNGNNNDVFYALASRPSWTLTVDPTQIRLPESSQLSYLRSRVYSASATNPWSQTLNLNGGDTAQQVIIPSGTTTGSVWHIDATNVTNADPDDLIALHQVQDGLGSLPSYRAAFATGLTITSASAPEIIVDTTPGELEFTGGTPTLWVDQFVTTEPGALVITGGTPLIATSTEIDVGPGALEITGVEPSLWLGVAITPAPDSLIIAPGAPEVIIYTESAAISSQQAILAAGEMIPDARAGQMAILAAGYVTPPVAASQQVILVMADAHPCASRLCQVWLLRRRDGVEFAFTSHDEPVRFMGRWFSPCASLNPSAVEAASDMAAVGNMELSGIIDAEGITEFDLYAGKFDDCRVDVWEVPWFGAFPHPIRLASGTMGSVSHGRDGFKGEVLGPGAKMQQQSVTQVVTAACRFTFGDARCTKDLGPLTETATVAAVSASAPFRTFRADALIGSGPEGYFSRGVVTWTSGPNEGVRSEVKEYDPATGTVVLWTLLPSPATAGDAFTISPGCTLAKDGDMGCVYWANLINFGGFPDVPGDDATSETPIAKV